VSSTTRSATAAASAWWPWLVLPASATALVSTGLVLGWASGAPMTGNVEAYVNAPLAIGFSTVAAGVWATRPDTVGLRRLGALYTVVGLASALVLPSHAWAHAASLPGAILPGAEVAGWLSDWVWALGAAPLMGVGLLLYPDGRLPGRRWWPAAVAGLTAPALLVVAGAAAPLAPGHEVWEVLARLGFPLLLLAAAAGLVALAVRYRRAPRGSDVRGQVGAFAVAGLLVVVAASLPERESPEQLLLSLVAGVALPATVATAVVRHRLLDPLADVERLHRRLDVVNASRRTLVTDREEERRRLRRDLHDGLGPSLAAIGLGLRQLESQVEAHPQAEVVRALGDEVQRAVVEVRRLCEGLRPEVLDELGLEGALKAATERLSALGGPEVVLVLDHLPRLPAAVEVAAFRVAMEATTNAVRHAGAQRVEVALSWADGLRLVVTDDGRGLPAEAAPGVGLRAMAERADELGGWTTTGATATGGTRVVAWLPAEGQP
jgi:signal transduction histidine kinase